MNRKLILITIVANFILLGNLVITNDISSNTIKYHSQKKATKSLVEPMVFSEHYEHSGTGSSYYILAQGTITSQTPKDFQKFINNLEERGSPDIYFDSPGGNLIAGIEMGKIIRDLGLNTYVGGPYVSLERFDRNKGDITKVLVEKGICFSACAYAFLGGTSRSIGTNGTYGVHQFYANENTKESITQITMTLIANYLDEMGIDRKLLDIASVTTADSIQPLSTIEAQKLNVDNTDPIKGEWQINVNLEGQLLGIVSQKQPYKNAIVSLYIFRSRNNLVGVIKYLINQKFRSKTELIDAFAGNGNYMSFSKKEYKKEYVLELLQPWQQEKDGSLKVSFIIDPQFMFSVAKEKFLYFNANFPNAIRDIDPSVTFSTDKLESILKAMYKQN